MQGRTAARPSPGEELGDRVRGDLLATESLPGLQGVQGVQGGRAVGHPLLCWVAVVVTSCVEAVVSGTRPSAALAARVAQSHDRPGVATGHAVAAHLAVQAPDPSAVH